MPKHPLHSFSLDSKTLFSSSEDEENHDLGRERLWKDWRFLSHVNSIAKYLAVPEEKLSRLSRSLNPVELQLQTVLEILYDQKLHYTNPLEHGRSSATRHRYIKSLGLDLSLELDQLIDDSNTTFEQGKVPEHWLSILPARSIEARHTLDSSFERLARASLSLLHSHWVNSGLLSADGEVAAELKPKRHTIAKNSLGRDIGIRAAPYLMLGSVFALVRTLKCRLWSYFSPFVPHRDSEEVAYFPNNVPSIRSLYAVKRTLNKYGVAVVRNVFSKEQIREIKSKLHLGSTLARENAFKLIEVDPNVSTFKFTRGRINCLLRGTTFNEALSPLQSFWMPFVYYFMKNNRRMFLSNVQLVTSDPMSFVEPWHRDNRHSGISVVVPLQDTDKSNGRLQFLPGTHEDFVKVNCYTTGTGQCYIHTGPVGVDVREGDLLIYNSSILHRATINESNVCQSMLVFSYDHVDTPPPGQGLIKYMIDNYYGNAIVNLNRLLV